MPHILVNTRESTAQDRQQWRRAIHQGKIYIDEKLTQKCQHEHGRRHGLLGASIPTVFRDVSFVVQIGVNSHRRAKDNDTNLVSSSETVDSREGEGRGRPWNPLISNTSVNA